MEAGASSIRNQPIFGLWKNRADLADPAAYVRNLRQPRTIGDPSASRRGETGVVTARPQASHKRRK
jgi:hypothetical protein